MEQYFNMTLNDDIFYDVIDFKGGSKCKITLKEKDFYIIGDMDYLGDRINNDQQIVLRAYSQYKIGTMRMHLFHMMEILMPKLLFDIVMLT